MIHTNTKVILKNRPVGYPKEEDFEIVHKNIDHLDNGEVIIEVLWLSLDPYMRGRMSAAKSYAAPLEIGEVITGGAVGKVIESKCPSFSIGNIVEGFSIGWQKFSKVKLSEITEIEISILRLAIHELKENLLDKAIVINEAIRLAKKFGQDSSHKFVNAVLDKISS